MATNNCQGRVDEHRWTDIELKCNPAGRICYRIADIALRIMLAMAEAQPTAVSSVGYYYMSKYIELLNNI